jgi:hypothetical protein
MPDKTRDIVYFNVNLFFLIWQKKSVWEDGDEHGGLHECIPMEPFCGAGFFLRRRIL